MTCIVGFIDNGNVYIGGDSAATNQFLEQRIRKDEKVFINGEFIFGYTDSFRMGQLLRYSFTPPKYIEEIHGDIFRYMCADFVNAVRHCLSDGGYSQNDKGEESGGTFMVGFRGRLFTIQSDYQVEETIDNYTAIGCGENFALGSLYTSKETDAEKKILDALKAAEYFSAGVASPFLCLKI